jgi:hypothetical protein
VRTLTRPASVARTTSSPINARTECNTAVRTIACETDPPSASTIRFMTSGSMTPTTATRMDRKAISAM